LSLRRAHDSRWRPVLPWVVSAALHAGLLAMQLRSASAHVVATSHDQLWIESTPHQSQSAQSTALAEAPTQPEPPKPHTRSSARAARRERAKPATPAADAMPTPDPGNAAEAAAAPSPTSDERPADATSLDTETGDGTAAPRAADEAHEPDRHVESGPTRTPGPAQMSFWLALPLLEHLTLIRPTNTLLMSVPGYRDALRGSGIRPFSDLTVLHIQLAGLEPAQLVVAGVHLRGEPALVEAATRVASMRELEPIWRGDGALRATSWIDGSGVDRGLAVHEAAFVIGARSSMPSLLGSSAPGARVPQLSRLRKNVVWRFVLEDAGHYLPAFGRCELQALSISVAAYAHSYRMSLNAEYTSATAAQQAATCLTQSGLQAAHLLTWLTGSGAAMDMDMRMGPGNCYQRNTEVARGDIEALFEELSRALRRSGRS